MNSLYYDQGARQNFLDTSTNIAKVQAFAMDALTDQKGEVKVKKLSQQNEQLVLIYCLW